MSMVKEIDFKRIETVQRNNSSKLFLLKLSFDQKPAQPGELARLNPQIVRREK